MAILQNLQKILTSVYGKDVRQAIHDAIYECYEDGKAGSVDLVARSGIAQLSSNLNTEYGSTVLYSDTTGKKAKDTEITLSDSYSNYDYIDIYTYTTAIDEVATMSVARGSTVCLRIPNVVDSGTESTALRINELILTFATNKLLISDHTLWAWNGSTSSGASKTTIEDETNTNATAIRKVVGRKISANAEVADIRTGYDGTTYTSAGEAVRSQISQCIGGGSGGLSNEAKAALLDCFAHVAWIDDDGQDYYDALESALYPPADLVSISAVYTQSGTVYDTDSLDDLKTDLVVTATYSDSTTETVTNYTLSGTLTAGTSTITVSYGGKTTSFTVTVTHRQTGYITDGLIHRWDGIDNTRSGHSDSTTTWYDLVGTYDLEMCANPQLTWNASSLTFAGGSSSNSYLLSAADAVESAANKTVEVVLLPTQSESKTVLQPFYDSALDQDAIGKINIFNDNTVSAQGKSANTYDTGLSAVTAVRSIVATINSTPAVVKVYVNGAEVSLSAKTHSMRGGYNKMVVGALKTSDANTAYPFTGRIYAIRIYNRNLTSAEIAQNYEIDCERFGFSS